MAQGRDQIIIDVLGNTKPLEKNIARVANQALTLNTKGFSQPLGKISGQLGEFEKSLAASNARVIAFGASAGAIFAIKKAFDETIKSVIEVEKSLTDINVILNTSQKNLANFGNRLFDIAKNTGTSFADVAKAATEFSRQGLGIEDTLKRTSDALILTRLSGLDTVSSVEALTAAINSFNSSALTSTEIVNKLAAVDAGFAVSSADLAEAIKRVGSSADDAGVSFDQLIALVTSAQQITSRGGSVIGNSLKTIFTRLQRPKTLDSLEEIGVATKDQEGNILPLIQILNNLSQTYEKLGSVQKAQIAETVGGVFQINVLKASLSDLSKEYSIYSQALATSAGATDEATRRNEALNQTLSASINRTVVNLQNAATDIGNLALAPAMQKALGGLNYVLENFSTDQTEGIGAKIGEGLAKGLGNFLSGPGLLLGAASLLKIFERLTVFTADAFKQLTGLNTQSAEQRGLQTQILNLIGRNPQIIEQINSGNINTASLHQQILNLIEQETVAMQRQVEVANSLTKSLMAAGVTIAQSGPMRGVAVKPKALGFIPNFSANQEVMGALAGGYAPGQIKQTFIPNYGQVTYNSAETVKKFPGMSQPAIMPPKQSIAGQSYQRNFQAAHGFNPYSFGGFIPNFARGASPLQVEQMISKGYVKAGGQELRSYLSFGASLNQTGKDLGVVSLGNDYWVPESNYKKLIYGSKQALEQKAFGRGETAMEGKLNPYALVYPSFQETTSFPTYGNAGGKKVGFYAVPFPGQLKGKDRSVIGPGLYGGAIDNIIDSASHFLVNLAGVDPTVINDQKFRRHLKSNISQDQIGSLVGNAFEGGILAAMNVIPSDRTRILDLSPAELKKLGETFKIGPLMSGGWRGGDFKNSLSGGNLDSMASKILNQQNMAFGFIPNFSPIAKAFKTEKSLGGSPTLDFQPGLGLYVRDAKTQPNFASVKRDHPEGLGAAMSNSYAMQKGMAAFGFVPNFITLPKTIPSSQAAVLKAGFTGDTSLKELMDTQKSLADEQNKTKFDLEKYREKLIFASFGLSMAGSFFSEIAGDNEKLGKNINSLSSGISTSLTAVQLIPGPIGLVVGGLGALYSAVDFIAKEMKSGGENIASNLEKIKDATTTFSNSTGAYSQALQKLSDAYANAKTPTETIVKLNQELAKAAMDLPEKYRLQLLAITDNVKLQEEINRIQGSLAREQKNLEFAAGVNKKLEESGIFTPTVFKTQAQTRGGGREIFAGLSDQGQTKFLEDLNDGLLKLNQPELITYLQKNYDLNADIADVLSRVNPEDFKNVSTSLYLFANGLKQSKEQFDAIDALRKDQIKTQNELAKETARAKNAVDSLSNSLAILINTSIRSAAFKQSFGQTAISNARSIGLSRAEGLLGYQELFKSPESVSAAKGKIEQLTRNEEFIKQAQEITTSSKQSILEIGANLLEDLRKPGQENPQSKAAINAFESTLLGISKQNISPTETASKLNQAISSNFGSSLDKSSEIQTKINDEVRQQNEKLATLTQEQKKSNEIAQNNLSIQERILQARRDIEAFGGAKGFLDPETLKSSFDNFTKSLNLYRGPGSRSLIERGRGAAGLLSETLGFAGGGFAPGTTGGLGRLRQEAITGRSIELRNQALSLSAQSPAGLRPVFRDIASRSTEIATRQIDNLVKSENIGQNVDEITQLLRSISASQTQTVMPELNNSIQNAISTIQQDLTPSIDALKQSFDKAEQTFSIRETYQNIGEKIGQQTITKAGAQYGLATANENIKRLTPQLQSAFQDLVNNTELPGSAARRNILSKGGAALSQAIQSGQKISLNQLGVQGGANTPFGQLVNEYNNQINAAENSRASIERSTKALDELNSRAVDAAAALIDLKQNVTPIGALAGPQTIQGSVDLKMPDNLQMNIGGRIAIDAGKVEVTLSPDSDLTTLVTPIVNDFINQAKQDIQSQFNDQIFKVREEAGLRRQPTAIGQ